MRIYFVRHGESQANLLREISNRGLRHGLTLKGREQAENLARRLEGIPIRRIYSSPILRAIETSVILSNRLAVDYEVTDALREYDCGILEGRSDDDAWKGWQDLFDAWTKRHEWECRIEGGESFFDIRNRFQPFIESLVEHYGDTATEVVCVSHGGLYWVMLPMVLKNIDTDYISQYRFGYTTYIIAEWRPAGLYCINWNGRVVAAQ